MLRGRRRLAARRLLRRLRRLQGSACSTSFGCDGVPSDSELADTRERLLSLLRMSPTLTQVVETDPSVLSDQEYVARSNPSLAEFLVQHPEVTRNPDFYLFANFPAQCVAGM